MENENKCIGCSVSNCANHSKNDNYCTLNSIQVGAPMENPQNSSCTECNSFRPCQG